MASQKVLVEVVSLGVAGTGVVMTNKDGVAETYYPGSIVMVDWNDALILNTGHNVKFAAKGAKEITVGAPEQPVPEPATKGK